MIQPMRRVDAREYRESTSPEVQRRWTSIFWPVVAFVVATLAMTIFDFGWLFVLGWTILVVLVHLLLCARRRRT